MNNNKVQLKVAWSIGLLAGPSLNKLAPIHNISNPIIKAQDINDCQAGFVADPFAIFYNSTWFLFFEIFDLKLNRGVVGCSKSVDLKNWQYLGVVLKEKYHLSYPYVFSFKDKIYMVPEGRKGGAVRLYESLSFPAAWEESAILLSGKYKDCSLVYDQEIWWMFAGCGAYSQKLFWSKDLKGPWKRHKKWFTQFHQKSKARPGGRVISYQGKLLRFAQDNRLRYGHQLRAFVIDQLSTRHYLEHQLIDDAIISPSGHGWNSHGMHHMDPHQLPDGSWVAFVDGEGKVSS